MNELTTVFKFVGEGNGAATGSATSSVATGDITMLVAGIVALLIGAVAIWATMTYRKRAVEGAHVAGSHATFMPLIVAVVAIVLGLGLTLASTSSIKAHAEGAITTDTCIGTVDEQTGSITFSNITMKNESDAPQVLNSFELVAADGVTTLNDATWTFNVEGESEPFFNGKFGDEPEEGWFPLTMPVDPSPYTLTVSATGISPDVAKSLIDKEVAYAVSYYDVESFTVDATVTPDGTGSITYSPASLIGLNVTYGTAYTVSGNTITFGQGDDAQTITFEAASGYKLTNWTLNGSPATSGNVTSDLSFVANTETSVVYYNGTVKLWGVGDTSETAKALEYADVVFNDGTSDTDSAKTDASGNFTLLKTPEKTAGTITISYTSDSETYSVVKKTIAEGTSGSLGDFEIRKLSSLVVEVYDKAQSKKISTHWCPAFDDTNTSSCLTKSQVKFYGSDYVETAATQNKDKTAYQMSDLKDGGWYYAFVATGVTLRCYQAADAAWTSTFASTGDRSTAKSLINEWNKDGSICTDTTAKTVYFDGTEAEKSQWACDYDNLDDIMPTLNGANYFVWYNSYGKKGGEILSGGSYLPWSAVTDRDGAAWVFPAEEGVPVQSEDFNEKDAVVLLKILSS